MNFFIAITLGYFYGSVPFSYLIAKFLKGVDLRYFGDRNVGASNVSLVAGKKAGIVAFFCDISKGVAPILICQYLLKFPAHLLIITGFSAILGHNWPIFLKFKGGKGLSTTIGVIGTLVPIEGAILIIPFLLFYLFLKRAISSLRIVSFFLPFLCYFQKRPLEIILGIIFILLFSYFRGENIKKILWGK